MILIIDDDEAQGELTRQRLESAGWTAKLQLGPFGNVAAIRRGDYALVILDVDMPALSGSAIMQLVNSGGSENRSTVLLYSNMDETELRTVAERCGADDYLTKSAGRTELVRKVRELARAPQR